MLHDPTLKSSFHIGVCRRYANGKSASFRCVRACERVKLREIPEPEDDGSVEPSREYALGQGTTYEGTRVPTVPMTQATHPITQMVYFNRTGPLEDCLQARLPPPRFTTQGQPRAPFGAATGTMMMR